MRKYAPILALSALSLAPTLLAQAADSPVVYKACEKKPTPDDTEAAKALFKVGGISYSEGDYPRAIQHWKDAFERDCTANLLLQNLANAYEKAGNLEAAIVSLETFLKRDPQNPDAPTMQKRIENMKKAKSAAVATTSAPAATSAPVATSAPAKTAPPVASSAPASRSSTPLIVAGTGGALLVVGALVYSGGKKLQDEAKGVCPDPSNCKDADARDKGTKGSSQMLSGSVMAGLGFAVGAGGLAWYFLSKPAEPKAARRYVVPEVAPGYAGFSLGGRW